MIKRIVAFLIFITWPISLFVANIPKDFFHYILPLDPKFAFLPLIFTLIYCQLRRPVLIIISILILLFFAKGFYGQSIFTYDYQARQQILQEEKLYNSVFLARLFQNKPRIPVTKFVNNLTTLIDPNNYFFGFAPGQIKVDNQNLEKFPFLSLPLFLIGLYYIKKYKHRKLVLSFLASAIIDLSLIVNFDRNDFVLWLPISLIIIYGLNVFRKKFKYSNYYFLIVILFSIAGLIKIFIR